MSLLVGWPRFPKNPQKISLAVLYESYIPLEGENSCKSTLLKHHEVSHMCSA